MENPQGLSARRALAIAVLLAAATVAAIGLARWIAGADARRAAEQERAITAFLAQHWQRPLAPQGAPPLAFSALEASLDPRACGQCHARQHEHWRESLHSRTMTAGVLWQLRLMTPQQANECLDCHAPLAEQKARVAQEHAWPNAPSSAAPDYVPASLAHDGLVCAACHVRSHERSGPPPRAGALPPTQAPHGGFTVSAAFEDSRFCASCHQFPDDGPRTAGKLREDTWRQWSESRFAAEGQTCQSCHMPDREHRWPGIHSPEMVRKALNVALDVQADGRVEARLTNAGAGHFFPTYMVPKVRARLLLVAADGRERLLAEDVIGWDVDVSLAEERFDTRLAPGASRSLRALLPASPAAGEALELRVDVAPREHYERTFRSMLDGQADLLNAPTLALLRQAYDEAVATRFEALRVRRPLAEGPGPQP